MAKAGTFNNGNGTVWERDGGALAGAAVKD